MARRAARPGLGLAIVAVLATDVFLVTNWNKSTPVTLAQSVEAFREAQAPEVASPAETTTTTAPPAAAASPGAAPTTTTAAPRARASTGAQAQPAAAGGGPAAAAAFTKPAAGVYVYATTGYEKVSIGGSRHDYPKETYAAVRQQAGCQWESEHRVIEEHVETARYCGKPNVLEFLSSTAAISFFGQTETRTVTCNPPETTVQIGDPVGARRQYVCTMDGAGSRITETVTYLGRETLPIGGIPVESFHVVVDGTQHGEAEGTSRFEVWVHPTTGLVLRNVSNVQSRSKAFGTTVEYTQEASHTLKSLTPAT
jgi:hypothetical protein